MTRGALIKPSDNNNDGFGGKIGDVGELVASDE
jgi:hypothetical protein